MKFSLNELLDEIAVEIQPYVDENCEVMVAMLAKKWGISGLMARKRLEALAIQVS